MDKKVDYNYMPKIVHRDNKRTRNESGWCCGGYTVRVPSLKDSKSTWNNFYHLFPKIKDMLLNSCVELDGNIFVVREERTHNGYTRTRTTKYLKTW